MSVINFKEKKAEHDKAKAQYVSDLRPRERKTKAMTPSPQQKSIEDGHSGFYMDNRPLFVHGYTRGDLNISWGKGFVVGSIIGASFILFFLRAAGL